MVTLLPRLLTCLLVSAIFRTPNAQDSPQDFLDAHNSVRAEVGVGDLRWSDKVAAYAQQYANLSIGGCKLVHSSEVYGENIAWSSPDLSGIHAVKLWVSEKQDYDYNSNSCASGRVCRHYTQVVWQNSVHLGCAKVRCNDNKGVFITCNYDPPGNVLGQRPYNSSVRINIVNSCSFLIWAAAVPGGGRQLKPNQTWSIMVEPSTKKGRIWARTGCTFDSTGNGKCDSGDCGGALECRDSGRAPHTLAEYSLNQFNKLDLLRISLFEGFNVGMEFSPLDSSQCDGGAKCAAEINGLCPMELRDPGGCNNPCTVFRNDQFCCTSSGACGPTSYSKFFKDLCPLANVYATDDSSTFTCATGTNYKVVFCP